jgi:hypothetical protein
MWHAWEWGETCTGKRLLERPRHRWEDGVKMDLREIGWGGCGVDSPGSGSGSLAGSCECDNEHSSSGIMELVTSLIFVHQ